MREAVAIGHQLVEGSALGDVPIPYEVPESVAAVDATVDAWNRIDEDMAVRNDRVRERIVQSLKHASRDVSFGDRAAPGDVAGVNGFSARKEALPTRREDTIGEHEKVTSQLLPAGEAEIHFLPALVKPDQRRALMISLAAKFAEQGPVEAAPRDKFVGYGLLPEQ